MSRVLRFISAAALAVGSVTLTPIVAQAASPATGYAVGDVQLGSAGSAQSLTFAMVDTGAVGDRGSVTYANPGAGVDYTASVLSTVVVGGSARFAYVVPATAPPSVRGLAIAWKVSDTAPDTAGFAVAASADQARTWVRSGFTPTNSYTVTSGDLQTRLVSSLRLEGYALGNARLGTTGQPRQHLAFVTLDYGSFGDRGTAFYRNLDAGVAYHAGTPDVRVAGHEARFDYTVPAGTGSLGGTVIVWKVRDGAPDTAGFSVAASTAAARSMVNLGFTPANSYGVVSGDIVVVHRVTGTAIGTVWFGPSTQRQQMTFNVADRAWGGDSGTVTYRNLTRGLSYTAAVVDVRVSGRTAWFDYRISTGSLAGTIVVWRVIDMGTPGPRHDRVGFSVAGSLTAARSMVARGFTPTNDYVITAGNLVVTAF